MCTCTFPLGDPPYYRLHIRFLMGFIRVYGVSRGVKHWVEHWVEHWIDKCWCFVLLNFRTPRLTQCSTPRLPPLKKSIIENEAHDGYNIYVYKKHVGSHFG